MKKSACLKSKRSCSGWVARHFIWFSATRMAHWSRRRGVKLERWSWESETAVPKRRRLERARSRSLGSSAARKEDGRVEAASVLRESWRKSRRLMECWWPVNLKGDFNTEGTEDTEKRKQ